MCTEAQAIAWLQTERANLCACVGYAAPRACFTHAIAIPAAISDFLREQGHGGEAVSLGQVGLAAARTAGDREGEAWALNQLGIAWEQAGDYPAAVASQSRALDLFGEIGNRRGQAWALNQLGLVRRLTGDYPAAVASQSKALDLIGDWQGQAWALNQLAAAEQQLTGDYRAAAARQYRALDLFRKIGDRRGQAWALADLGWCSS